MSFAEKLKDSILSHAVEASAASIVVVMGFLVNDIALPLLPYIEDAISKKSLLSLLVLSLFVNLSLLAFVWLLARKDELRLKYGIYWDKNKNPHCPSCKKPLSAFGDYGTSGKGYFCKSCSKVIPLTDAFGNGIKTETALSEL